MATFTESDRFYIEESTFLNDIKISTEKRESDIPLNAAKYLIRHYRESTVFDIMSDEDPCVEFINWRESPTSATIEYIDKRGSSTALARIEFHIILAMNTSGD